MTDRDRRHPRELQPAPPAWFRFSRDCHAAVAVEFAWIAPFLIAFILCLVQIGYIFFARSFLDTGMENTARLVLVGSAQPLTAAQFSVKLCANLPAIFQCSGLMVNMQPAASLATINTTTPTLTYDANGNVTNKWVYNGGGPGSIMVVQVLYQLPVIAGPLFGYKTQPNGSLLLMTTAVFLNEPTT